MVLCAVTKLFRDFCVIGVQGAGPRSARVTLVNYLRKETSCFKSDISVKLNNLDSSKPPGFKYAAWIEESILLDDSKCGPI